MCEFITLGTAAVAATSTTLAIPASAGLFGTVAGGFSWGSTLSTLGSAMGAFGALYSGQTASANANYQGKMAEYQAALDENNAIMAEQSAAYEADIIDDRRKRFVGAKEARTGKSGVVIADGSSLATTINSVEEFTAERLAVLYKGDVQAAANRAGASGQKFAAQNAYQNAERAEYGSYINAATQIGQGAYRGGLLA